MQPEGLTPVTAGDQGQTGTWLYTRLEISSGRGWERGSLFQTAGRQDWFPPTELQPVVSQAGGEGSRAGAWHAEPEFIVLPLTSCVFLGK